MNSKKCFVTGTVILYIAILLGDLFLLDDNTAAIGTRSDSLIANPSLSVYWLVCFTFYILFLIRVCK